MDTQTASTRTEGLLALYDLHTKFFERAIEGISEEDTYNRLNTKANHMAWLAGSAVSQRYLMVSEAHPDMRQTGDELFRDNKGLQEDARYPAASVYMEDWKKISPVAREVLVTMNDAKLNGEMDMGFMKMTYFELLTFTIYREASLIGQLALWRRLLGYPALKYD